MTTHEQKLSDCAKEIGEAIPVITKWKSATMFRAIEEAIARRFPEPVEKVCECNRSKGLVKPFYCDHCGGKIV